jgi:hypothetical protein
MHEKCARPDYNVVIPGSTPFRLYRLVKHSDRAREQDFRSRAARGAPRIWPDEDAADYFSVSCYDDVDIAKANAAGSWRGVAAFDVDGHQGFVYAQTYEPHHFSVWGDSTALHNSVAGVESLR